MTCGCPVLSSNRASLPEVGGNAAEYFNPVNSHDLARKIMTIVRSKKKQEKMREKGFINCKKFTKEIFIKKIKKVYDQIENSH